MKTQPDSCDTFTKGILAIWGACFVLLVLVMVGLKVAQDLHIIE